MPEPTASQSLLDGVILIVDDNPISLKLTRLLLVSADFKVRIAGDAETALALVAESCPRLILTDIQLPGMDGLAMTRQLKSQDATRGIPTLALTSYARRDDEEAALAAGCDGYITKPIELEGLLRAVRRHLGCHAQPGAPLQKGR